MKDGIFMAAFAVLSFLIILNFLWQNERFTAFVVEVGQALDKRDERMFGMNNRLQTLEEQRDIEARVTTIEKSLRIYCTGTKTEMCGSLDTVDR